MPASIAAYPYLRLHAICNIFVAQVQKRRAKMGPPDSIRGQRRVIFVGYGSGGITHLRKI
jgi:hypothetical protein